MCKEIYLGRLLVDADVPDAVLRKLADGARTCTRAEWAAAFRITLRRKSFWRAISTESGVVELRRQVAAAGGKVNHLSTLQILTLAQPVDTIGEGWGCALSYWAQNMLHFAEVRRGKKRGRGEERWRDESRRGEKRGEWVMEAD